MIKPNIKNEFSLIKRVVLGIADNFGGCPTIEEAYDPKSKQNILKNTFPIESQLIHELSLFEQVLKKYHVEVIRPENIFNCNQVFTRDVGFVIDDKLFLSNMINKRSLEVQGFEFVLKQINSQSIYNLPDDIFVEGGDVIVSEKYLFIGFSKSEDFKNYEVARTNVNAINYFQKLFPNKKVIGFELNKSDINPYKNCLHLDCCFQPLGLGHVLVCPYGFKNPNDLHIISDIFGKENIVFISDIEMYNMFSNIFSISKSDIVSDVYFTRLNDLLTSKGYNVECISFSETSKMGGLFRCATLPLERL